MSNEADTKSTDNKPRKHLGFEVIDKCPCGKKVDLCERQELVFSTQKQAWMRACRECLQHDRTFSASV